MPSHHESRQLPFAQRQLFELVADVEKYPAFLEWFVAARVRQRVGNWLEVDQVVRFKGVRARFTTHAVLDPPRRIDIICHDPPFKRFDQRWTFVSIGDNRTIVEYGGALELRSLVLQHAMQLLFDEPQIAKLTMDAFVRRAHQLYGTPAGPPIS